MGEDNRYQNIEQKMKDRHPPDDDCASRSIKAVLFLFALAMVILANTSNVRAENGVGLVAKQHRIDACLLGAVATHLNYLSSERLYTSQSIALAYKARYGQDDWAKDGTTSYQVQSLIGYTGYRYIWGKMPVSWFLADTIRAGHYPIIFIGGVNQHAIVAISIDKNDLVVYAEPLEGILKTAPLEQLWGNLEGEKWFSYGSKE
jgi:hypothetical protein